MNSAISGQTPAIVWGYCRVSTEQQDEERQRLEILEYANQRKWHVDRLVTCKVSSRRDEHERGIDVLKAAAKDRTVTTIVFSELSRLGRSVGEICRLIDYLADQCGCALHFIKERMILEGGKRNVTTKVLLTTFSLLAEIERDLISERTKSALAARKAAGVRLGRPPLKSKLDGKEAEIREMVRLCIKQKAIAAKVSCTEATLSNWLKRKRREWVAA
jgi:DNA invertase Pin-like site-specific DNA recombinase